MVAVRTVKLSSPFEIFAAILTSEPAFAHLKIASAKIVTFSTTRPFQDVLCSNFVGRCYKSKLIKKVVSMETSNCRKRLLLKLFHDKFWERAQIKRVFLGCKRKDFAPRPYNPEVGLIIATTDNPIVVIRVSLHQNQR